MKVDHHFHGRLGDAGGAASRAAAAGFDGFLTAETAHDPFLPLVPAAQSGLELGTAVAVAFPRSPMVVAQSAWDLAALTGGRFRLGLGTQVKAHVVRRFSGGWAPPVARLREYVGALRRIWHSFQTDEPLLFEGDHYRFSLLTPFFSPGPIDHPHIPVSIAGVGPALCRLAGEVCDGFHVHPFHTVEYLDDVVLDRMAGGASAAGRALSEVERMASVFVITGSNAEEVSARREAVRAQIAFYASTPTYRRLLELHGWEVGPELAAAARRGEWSRMARMVPGEMVDEIAVTGAPDEIGPMIRRRYGDRIQRIGLYPLPDLPPLSDDITARIVSDLHR